MMRSIAAEPADNHPRCPVILLLDTSGSMQEGGINELNAGIKDLHEALLKDPLASKRVEVAIVTFDDSARCVAEFTRAPSFVPPVLKAKGQTAMGAGILLALQTLEQRHALLDSQEQDRYKPWIFLITDGRPEGEPPHLIEQASEQLKALDKRNQILFYAIGVQAADMNALGRISPTPPHKLKGLGFAGLFKFISRSISRSVQASPALGDQLPREIPSGNYMEY